LGGGISGISVNILDSYPLLFAHQKKISHLPKAVEWNKKLKQLPPKV